MKPKVSLVVITLNEENNIERCLKSADFVDEMVVLDSGSSDKTVEISKGLGARTFVEDFRGYHGQKVRATELAEHDWILSLDADEALSPELASELQEVLKDPYDVDGFETPRLSYHMGRWIWHGGWYPDAQIRCFDRRKTGWKKSHVHERVEGKKTFRLKHPIYHFVFKDLADQVETNNEYSTLGAKDLQKRGRSFSLLLLIGKPISKFLETYIWKRGFLDGLPGFIIAVGAAYSVFLKFAKLWEQQNVKHHNLD